MSSSPPSFSNIRSLIWPVHRKELPTVLPLFLIFFLVSFAYNLLRCMKDTLIITAEGSGAEAIPFIKLWAMLPSALLLTYLFTKLSSLFTREKVFYIMLFSFLSFFFLFTHWIYPIRSSLEPVFLVNYLRQTLPLGFSGFVSMVQHWPLTLFYVMSEMWGVIMLTMLSWGFANEILHMHEAKRFYAIFSLGLNSGGIISGQYARLLCSSNFSCFSWEESMSYLVSSIIISGCLAACIFYYMNKKNTFSSQSLQKKKTRLSMRESFAFLLKSPYLAYLAILVLSYNLIFNLIDVQWKHNVHSLYPDPLHFNTYMNQVSSVQGMIATFISLFISGWMIRSRGWTFTALITPLFLLVSSLFIFPVLLSQEAFLPFSLVVMMSSAQICFGRASKYTFFDNTKELAFIPLDKISQRKGKAAIDGVGSRLGKSGGSLIYQILFLFCSSFSATTPFVAGIIFLCIALWIVSTLKLGKKIQLKTS